MRFFSGFILVVLMLLFQRANSQSDLQLNFSQSAVAINAGSEFPGGFEYLADTLSGLSLKESGFKTALTIKSLNPSIKSIILVLSVEDVVTNKNIAYKAIDINLNTVDSAQLIINQIDLSLAASIKTDSKKVKCYLWNKYGGDFQVEKFSLRVARKPSVDPAYEVPSDFSINQKLVFGLAFLVLIAFSLGHFEVYPVFFKYRVFFLFGAALLVFLSAIFLSAFANVWDERIHFLVAKNAANNSFIPLLYQNPVLDLPYDSWIECKEWLHKQPFFIWLMVLSIKVFGTEIWAYRLPSAAFMTLTVVAVYDFSAYYLDKVGSYFAAILALTSSYFIQLVSGLIGMEHNDIAFVSLITLSIWSFNNYIKKGGWKYLILVGLFSGCAILTKWLVGLWVYSAWGVFLIFSKQFNRQRIIHFLISLGVCALVVMPWQLYIFSAFPDIASKEAELNTTHFFEVVEGHDGDNWFHLDMLPVLFGNIFPFIVLPGLFLFVKSVRGKNSALGIAIAIMLLVLYGFFTLAATKMPNFTLPAFIIICCAFGAFISFLVSAMPTKKWRIAFGLALGLVTVYYNFDYAKLRDEHTNYRGNNIVAMELTHNMAIYNHIKLSLPANAVLLNMPGAEHINAMFYTGKTAYNKKVTPAIVDELKQKGYHPYVFQNTYNVAENLDVMVLPYDIKGAY